MQKTHTNHLTRIGVFYDGNYFLHVSNYYNFTHERRSRISINGLHDFIRKKVAEVENNETKRCQIVDAHYFRGRLTAGEASQRGDLLFYERVFDDILMAEGVTTHYLPVRSALGRKYEKGIDVWLALEAFEMAFYKRFDVLVLIAADGDYVPLARKLNTLGTRVMVLGWDFEYMDEEGNRFFTRTSQDLLEEVTYPIAMQDVIENSDGNTLNQLFVVRNKLKPSPKPSESLSDSIVESEHSSQTDGVILEEERKEGTVMSLKEGFGFIKFPPNNVFFHHSSLRDYDFNDLAVGDMVTFTLGSRDNGRAVAYDVSVTPSV